MLEIKDVKIEGDGWDRVQKKITGDNQETKRPGSGKDYLAQVTAYQLFFSQMRF